MYIYVCSKGIRAYWVVSIWNLVLILIKALQDDKI